MSFFLRTLLHDEPGSIKAKIIAIVCFVDWLQSGGVGLGVRGLSSLSGAAGHGVSGLQFRPAPRRGRRPHRGHRQRHAQADAAGQAAGCRGADVLAGPFDDRRRGLTSPSPPPRWRCSIASTACRQIGGLIGTLGLRALSLRHRDRQPDRASFGLSQLSAGAARRAVCRGRLRSAAGQSRLSGAPLPPHVQPDPAQLAHVSAGRSVWPGLRHRDRDRPAGHLRRRSLQRAFALRRSWSFRCSSPRECRSSIPPTIFSCWAPTAGPSSSPSASSTTTSPSPRSRWWWPWPSAASRRWGCWPGEFHLTGGVWNWVGKLNENFGVLGYCIIALFAVSWILSIAIYKWRRFDDLEFGARDAG